jgi:GT2 family glycosyltransferase
MRGGVDVLIPVMGRPERIVPILESIKAATPEPYSVYFAANDEPTLDIIEGLDWEAYEVACRSIDDGDTYPNRINTLFEFSNAEFVFLAADDYNFRPGWLPPLLEAQRQMGPGVAVPNDLHNPYGTCALVSREYVLEVGAVLDEPGHVLFSGYSHNWCDNELASTAKRHGRYRYVEESIVEHLHPCTQKPNALPEDPTYAKGNRTFLDDQQLYASREHLWRGW